MKAFISVILILIVLVIFSCRGSINDIANMVGDNVFVFSEMKKIERIKILFAADFYCINGLGTTKGDEIIDTSIIHNITYPDSLTVNMTEKFPIDSLRWLDTTLNYYKMTYQDPRLNILEIQSHFSKDGKSLNYFYLTSQYQFDSIQTYHKYRAINILASKLPIYKITRGKYYEFRIERANIDVESNGPYAMVLLLHRKIQL
jgi:hypothetical protein